MSLFPVTIYHWKDRGSVLSAQSLQTFIHWWYPPRAFASPGWTVPILPAFPHRRDVPAPQSSFWPFFEFTLLCPCLFCTGVPRTRCSAPRVGSALWMEGKDHPPWPAGNTSNEAQDTFRLLSCKDTLVVHVPPRTYQDPLSSFSAKLLWRCPATHSLWLHLSR